MKKVLWIVTLCATMLACGKDNPANDTTQQPPVKPSETETPAVVKDEELFKYFDLDKEMPVYQALDKLKKTQGVKSVEGRSFDVTAVDEVSRDEQAGKFAVTVTGSVARKPFKKTLNFEGFLQKPADWAMAKRAVAVWKSGTDYQKTFDFDTLYRLKDTGKFTAAYLSQFVDFMSSAADGTRHYPFSAEDLAKTVVSEVQYKGEGTDGNISFVVTYNGIKGSTSNGMNGKPSLPFDKNAYYAQLITLSEDAAKTCYMRGVYENLDVFYAKLLQYDSETFVPRLVHKEKNDTENSIEMTILLTVNDGSERELAQFSKTVAGFKPLSDFGKEVILASTTDVGQRLGRKFRNTADGDKLSQMPAVPVQAWISKVQMGLKREGEWMDLLPEKKSGGNGSSIVTVWRPASAEGWALDLYFENPRFEVVEARKEGNFLHMKLRLNAVNDVALEGVTMPLTVHLLP